MNFIISFLTSFISVFLIYLIPIKRFNTIQLYLFSIVLFCSLSTLSFIWLDSLVLYFYSIEIKSASLREMQIIKPFLNFIGLLITWSTVGMLITSAKTLKTTKNKLLVKIPSGLTLMLSVLILLLMAISASSGRLI